MFIPLHSVHLFRYQQKSGRLPTGITGRIAPESVVDLLRNDWSAWAGICTGTQFTTNNDETWVYTYSYTKDNFFVATTYTHRLSVLFDKDGIVKNISKGAQ